MPLKAAKTKPAGHMPRLLTFILLLLSLSPAAQFRGLIINEFSQGDQGSREYIELLVVGHRTCSDSTADIRGWIVDDQNGWYGTTNISSGHYRFKNVPLWSAVPYGSLIVLYNAASGQKNLSLTLPDDSTDANNDGVYVLPINTKTLLEEHDNEPDNAAPNPAYIYPPANSTTGYNGTSNLWIQHIALNNTGGDVLTVVSRTKRDSAFFSIGYGFTIGLGFRPPTVSIGNVGNASSAFLTDSSYKLSTHWTLAAVPLNETPGLPNGGVNTVWIQSMRTTPKAIRTYATVCSNGVYTFFGQTLTATGAYTVLYNNAFGCVDTNQLYVVIKQTDAKDTVACDSLVYKGTKYTSNTTLTDHISSVVINCDSIVRTLKITIRKSSSSLTKACAGAAQNYVFNGQTFTASGQYAVTLVNAQGCDSVARLQLVKTKLDSISVSGCGSATYNGQTYTASTVRYDTVKSIGLACDSIIRRINIVVNAHKSTSLSACAAEGTIYNQNGTFISAPGLYTFTYTTNVGCDSVVKLYLVFRKTIVDTTTGCDSVWFENRWHYTSTSLNDTVRSLVSSCDSIVRIHRLFVNRSKIGNLTVCVPAGSNYVFFGQSLTASGVYLHTVPTVAGCDSIIRLQLTIAKLQTQAHTGCDSVRFIGQSFYTSAVISDTLRSRSGCDSLIRIDSISIYKTARTYLNVCLAPGQAYNFNGQALTASGNYAAIFTGMHCDSIVHLNLLVAQRQTLTYRDCNRYTYNGVTYTSSVTMLDTLRSATSGCDSVLRTVQILIQPIAPAFTTACLAEGDSYIFNGQVLTATGSYRTTYVTATGCDSVVNLYLVVGRKQSDTVVGCEKVTYKGIAYSASTLLTDTVKSVISGCDSSISRVTIVVHPKPLLAVTRDTTICLGDVATLTATSPGATVVWTGFGNTSSISVSPQATIIYSATAVDVNGCINNATTKVIVEDFSLTLTTSSLSVLAGSGIAIQANGNLSYAMVAWQPASLFINQTARTQQIYLDSSLTISAIAQTPSGCADTASLPIVVMPLDDVYIPSGFTPNGDGRNDDVKVVGMGLRELDFKIFNRWGQMLFHSTDRGKGWDGKAGGVLQPAGIYVFVARVKKVNGQMLEKKGTVMLIR